jgi:hypothetical protein
MDKTELCEAVRAIKEDYNLSYRSMCEHDNSPVNTTQLGHILKRNGENVSIEKIISLLEWYGLTVKVSFTILSYEEDK